MPLFLRYFRGQFLPQTAKTIAEAMYSNTVTLDNKTIHIRSPPLYSKLGCLLFFTSNSNSRHNIAWRGQFYFPLLKLIKR